MNDTGTSTGRAPLMRIHYRGNAPWKSTASDHRRKVRTCYGDVDRVGQLRSEYFFFTDMHYDYLFTLLAVAGKKVVPPCGMGLIVAR